MLTRLHQSFSIKGIVSLIIKNSTTMVALRATDVPLRTHDGGATWTPLTNCAKISTPGYTRSGSYSWSGNTLVLFGRDNGAPSRGEYASFVWRSTDDGDTSVASFFSVFHCFANVSLSLSLLLFWHTPTHDRACHVVFVLAPYVPVVVFSPEAH